MTIIYKTNTAFGGYEYRAISDESGIIKLQRAAPGPASSPLKFNTVRTVSADLWKEFNARYDTESSIANFTNNLLMSDGIDD